MPTTTPTPYYGTMDDKSTNMEKREVLEVQTLDMAGRSDTFRSDATATIMSRARSRAMTEEQRSTMGQLFMKTGWYQVRQLQN